MQCKTKRSVIE